MRRLSTNLVVLGAIAAGCLSSAGPGFAADSILADVLHRGSVRIAVTTGNEPRQFVDENGNLQGYDIDIANELGKQLGVKVEFIRTDVAGRVAMLQSHKADVTVATFTPTLDRLKTVAFTDAYTTDVLTLMTRADRKELAQLADFDKPEIKIALGRGSTAAKALAKYIPKATIVELPGLADIVQAIDAGQVDATCSNDGLVSWTRPRTIRSGCRRAISFGGCGSTSLSIRSTRTAPIIGSGCNGSGPTRRPLSSRRRKRPDRDWLLHRDAGCTGTVRPSRRRVAPPQDDVSLWWH
jgi:polar amino acid transport system substrate-binding protein